MLFTRRLTITVFSLLVSGPAFSASCENPVRFDIRAQPVASALLEFAQQAGVSILFPSGAFGTTAANSLAGEYCIEQALAMLLDGVDVSATLDSSGQLIVGNLPENLDTAAGASEDDESGPLRGAINKLKNMITTLLTGSGEEARQRSQDALLPEEIIVTGSRIRQVTGMTAPTPVTRVATRDLALFNPGSTVAEQLDALPQFFSTQTAQRGGTTFIDAGGSYLNLRGMGPNRTLILLNGTRVIPSDSFGNVNVDNFPIALLSDVEIVTGGASAAYGADAISGVVNFELDREFEGLKASLSTGITQRGDGDNWRLSVAGGGHLGDRLHLLASVEARQIDQIDPDPDRLDSWRNWGFVRNPAWSPDDPPGTHPQRLTMPRVFPTTASPQGLITTPGFAYTNYTFTDDGTGVRPYQFGEFASPDGPGALRTQAGGPEYDTWRAAMDGGPDSNEVVQRSLFSRLTYALSDTVDVFGQVLVGRTESNAYGRRGNPALFSIWSARIYPENPFLPADVRDAMLADDLDYITVSKRGTVYGPDKSNYYADRDNRNINQLESYSAGVDIELPRNWRLQVNYQHGKSRVSTSALNILRLDNFFMALDAVPDPQTGQPVCHVSVTNPTPEQLKASVAGKLLPSPLSLIGVAVDSPIGPMDFADCVPINVFGLGNVSPAARDWVEDEEKKNRRTLDQDFAEILLSGELHEGWGAGPLTLATGLTWRTEKFSQVSYPLWGERGLANAPEIGIRGIPGGFTGPGNRSLHQFSAIGVGRGNFDVSEWFGELNVPVFNLDSGQALGASLAYRNSNYSAHHDIKSWKIGLDLQLIDSLRWRATRSRDVREPNFSEQFVSGVGGATLNDPVFNESYVITSIGGPNPDLATELADTITTGFVYQPDFAPWVSGLQLAVDWFEIDLSSAVARLGPQRLTDNCYRTQDPAICALVQRNPDTNRVDRIIDRYFNVGGAKTAGVDMEVQYSLEPDWFPGRYERLGVRGFVGYLRENSTTTASGVKVDSVQSSERPEYTANIMLNYDVGNWGLRLQQRYYDSTLFNTDWTEGVDVDDNSISSQSITNLAFSYGRDFTDRGDWRASFYITNLFDREPPVIPGQVLSNSHDQYGRRFQLSLDMNF